MGSEPVDAAADPGWFEFIDDTIEVHPSTEADRAFLAGLRARAAAKAWDCERMTLGRITKSTTVSTC